MSRVEAYGIYGKRRKAWRRTFDSIDLMRTWAERHSAQVFGTRVVTAEEWHASRRAA